MRRMEMFFWHKDH